LKTWSIG